ncbi:hypothetical protein BH24CHL1_BH24CHL1_00700 [soil metagenome]
MVVAATVGWRFEFVTLEHHPRYTNLWGYVQYSRPLETRADLNLWAPTFLAGQFGEIALLNFAGPGASQDNAMVMEQVRNFIPDPTGQRACFRAALERARQIVHERQPAVRAVASALLAGQTLQSAQTLTIIESAKIDERGV